MAKRYPFTLIKEKLAARKDRVLDFAVGRLRFALPDEIGAWIRANPELALQSSTRAEVEHFTAAAAELLAREYAVDIAPENILPAPGGRAAMSAFVAYALEPGDSVFVTEPGYPAFARLARHRHAQIHDVLLNGDVDFVPDFGAALKAALHRPRVIALNYPNNPTGAILTGDTVAAIRGAASAATIVFNDATYGPLVYDEPPQSLLRDGVLEGADIERVELHSFSKLFPLGPIALSFLAGSSQTMEEVSTYSEFAWSPPSKMQLGATAMCLRDEQRFRELRDLLPRQIATLREALVACGFAPFAAPAGVYVLCRVPESIGGKAVTSAEEAAVRLIDEFDLAVVPWDTPESSYLRFSALHLPEDVERLQALGDTLQLH